MNTEEMTVRLTELELRVQANGQRISDLSQQTEAFNRLATAVEVMATKQDTMGRSVNRLESKVDALEAQPGKRWETLVDKLLCAAAGAFAAWVLAGIPGLNG